MDAGGRIGYLAVEGVRTNGTGAGSDRAGLVAVYGTLGATVRLAEHLGVRADLAWGGTLSPLVVSVDGGSVAEWGRPLVVLAAGLDTDW